jgi:ATP-dependent DNA helicase RecQ
VKDYKLCTTTRNDPVRDAELAYELFLDQREALQQRVAEYPDEALCLHFLLAAESGKGVANLFAALRHKLRPSHAEARAAWSGRPSATCISGQRQLLDCCFSDADWHKPLAYVLSWLRVAGGNSVLPPWVGLNFPRVREAIANLRDVPCADPACTGAAISTAWRRCWRAISRITRFRATPATPDGRSLQRAIVENGLPDDRRSRSCRPAAVNLCFQLPALARFYRNGSLTVVISPLQSLMKDQVGQSGSARRHLRGLPKQSAHPLERQTMLEKLRLGDLGLIFVAPEQFRSTALPTLSSIGKSAPGCLTRRTASKWGHDFRPDYLYVSRFIKARQRGAPSPVFCFTATAKPDVVADICAHFEKQLGITLDRLEGGVSRENLNYEVRLVPVGQVW